MLALLAWILLGSVDAAQELSRLTVHELVCRIPRLRDDPGLLDDPAAQAAAQRGLAELRQRLERGAALELRDWKTILFEKGYLRWRERWPVDEPFALALHAPRIGSGLRVRLVPRAHAWRSASATDHPPLCGFAESAEWDQEDFQELGQLERLDREIEFELRVLLPSLEAPFGGCMETHPETCLGTIAIPVEPVARLEEVLPCMADRELEARIGRAIASGMRVCVGDVPLRGPWIGLAGAIDGIPGTVALHVEGAVRHDGRTVQVLSFDLEPCSAPHVRLRALPLEVARGGGDARAWTLGLHGTSYGVLRRWDATSYWAGVIEVPLAQWIRR